MTTKKSNTSHHTLKTENGGSSCCTDPEQEDDDDDWNDSFSTIRLSQLLQRRRSRRSSTNRLQSHLNSIHTNASFPIKEKNRQSVRFSSMSTLTCEENDRSMECMMEDVGSSNEFNQEDVLLSIERRFRSHHFKALPDTCSSSRTTTATHPKGGGITSLPKLPQRRSTKDRTSTTPTLAATTNTTTTTTTVITSNPPRFPHRRSTQTVLRGENDDDDDDNDEKDHDYAHCHSTPPPPSPARLDYQNSMVTFITAFDSTAFRRSSSMTDHEEEEEEEKVDDDDETISPTRDDHCVIVEKDPLEETESIPLDDCVFPITFRKKILIE
jgi:hypothetical protein